MNYSKFRFTLDMHKHQSQVSIPVMRGDTAVRLYITLTDGGHPYTIGSSCYAILIGNKPTTPPTTIRHPCIIEGGGTYIRYDFQIDTSDVSGAIPCEIRLYGANGILTAPCFTIVVDERIPHYDEDASKELVSAFDKIFLTEEERIEAEKTRCANEVVRIEAEASRVKAENSRVEAETSRVEAEKARIEARITFENNITTTITEHNQKVDTQIAEQNQKFSDLEEGLDNIIDIQEKLLATGEA